MVYQCSKLLLLKSLVWCLLLIAFYKFYFVEVTYEFGRSMTNFATTYQDLEEPITTPASTICIKQMKGHKLKELNISKAFFASEDENYGKYILWPDMTISEAFDAVTYKLGRDFGIKFCMI